MSNHEQHHNLNRLNRLPKAVGLGIAALVGVYGLASNVGAEDEPSQIGVCTNVTEVPITKGTSASMLIAEHTDVDEELNYRDTLESIYKAWNGRGDGTLPDTIPVEPNTDADNPAVYYSDQEPRVWDVPTTCYPIPKR